MKFEKFEDLIVWQKAQKFSVEIYRTFRFLKDYGFKDQIQRAGISIGNNIAEGYERKSNADFIKFLFIAKGSCGEVRSMLYVALDLQMIDQSQFENLINKSIEIGKMLSGLIKSLSEKSSSS